MSPCLIASNEMQFYFRECICRLFLVVDGAHMFCGNSSPSDAARLIAPRPQNMSGPLCGVFYYQQFGGQFSVLAHTHNGSVEPLFNSEGYQGHDWHEEWLSIPPDVDRLLFNGVCHDDGQDHILSMWYGGVWPGECQKSANESYDKPKGWVQDKHDQIDWMVYSGEFDHSYFNLRFKVVLFLLMHVCQLTNISHSFISCIGVYICKYR